MRPVRAASVEAPRLQMEFEDNKLLPALFGERDQFIDKIERELGVSIVSRGNRVMISGAGGGAEIARGVLGSLYERLKRGLEVDTGAVDAALRMARHTSTAGPDQSSEIRTRKRQISARSPTQTTYIQALKNHDLVFGLGPAGTGKTYLAVAMAVDLLMTGKVERIVLSRPAVEAGERLGFLPGDLKEKVDPYLRPLYDALHDMLPGDQVAKRLATGEIEIAPLAFMRGRTLTNAFVILDEAQNTTPVQMKMFLTRLGENARMAVTGDLSQIDLPMGVISGLSDAIQTLDGVEGIAMVTFTAADVVRHPLVARIVKAYDARQGNQRKVASKAAPAAEPKSE